MSEILINLPSPTLHLPTSIINKNDEYLYKYDDFLEEKLNEQKEKFSRIAPQKSFLPNVIFFNCIQIITFL
jgi:hypothetical protein